MQGNFNYTVREEYLPVHQPLCLYLLDQPSPDLIISFGVLDLTAKMNTKKDASQDFIRNLLRHSKSQVFFIQHCLKEFESYLLSLTQSSLFYDIHYKQIKFDFIQDLVHIPDCDEPEKFQRVCDNFQIIIYIYSNESRVRSFYPENQGNFPILYLSHSEEFNYGLVKSDKLYKSSYLRHIEEIFNDHFNLNRIFEQNRKYTEHLCLYCSREISFQENQERIISSRLKLIHDLRNSRESESSTHATLVQGSTEGRFNESDYFENPVGFLISFTNSLVSLYLGCMIKLKENKVDDNAIEAIDRKLDKILNENQNLSGEDFFQLLEAYKNYKSVNCQICKNFKPIEDFSSFCRSDLCITCVYCRARSIAQCELCSEKYFSEESEYLVLISNKLAGLNAH